MKLCHFGFQAFSLVGFISLLYIPQNNLAAVSSGEYQALADIFNNMNGLNWRNKTNWMNGDPCAQAWAGVNCSQSSVISVFLDSNNLVGPLPNSFSGLRFVNNFSAGSNSINGDSTFFFANLPASMIRL